MLYNVAYLVVSKDCPLHNIQPLWLAVFSEYFKSPIEGPLVHFPQAVSKGHFNTSEEDGQSVTLSIYPRLSQLGRVPQLMAANDVEAQSAKAETKRDKFFMGVTPVEIGHIST